MSQILLNSPELYYLQVAKSILHWWQFVVLSLSLMALLVTFFFTMHKGLFYRIAFLWLLVSGCCYLYALNLERLDSELRITEMVLPLFFTSLCTTSWSRALKLITSFKRYRFNLKELAENDQSDETDWVSYVETTLFAERLERHQKWLYAMIAGACAAGILNSNVTGVENALKATTAAYQHVQTENTQTKQTQAQIAQDLREQTVKDSLWHQYVKDDRAKQLAAINALKEEVKKGKPAKPLPPTERIKLIVPPAKSIQLKGTSKTGVRMNSVSHNEVPNPAPDTTLNYPVARLNKYQ